MVHDHRVVVSTPQVLLDALSHGYLNLGRDIGLLVFDEAHHARLKHPYRLIMKDHYHSLPPRIIGVKNSDDHVRPMVMGLTASPMYGGNLQNDLL